MTRILVALFLLVYGSSTVRAEPIFFVSVAEITADNQPRYEDFIVQVMPIWAKHNIEVLGRFRIVDASANTEIEHMPSEIGLLRVDSRANFNAYISDPAYRAIHTMRIDAVEHLLVLEGNGTGNAALNYLASNPMAAIRFSSRPPVQNLALNGRTLELKINLAGQVKGPVGNFMKGVRSVSIQALSFDDNPLDVFANRSEGKRLDLVGERVEP